MIGATAGQKLKEDLATGFRVSEFTRVPGLGLGFSCWMESPLLRETHYRRIQPRDVTGSCRPAGPELGPRLRPQHWVAVKELKLSYHNGYI